MNKILSAAECDKVEDTLQEFKQHVTQYVDNINNSIRTFNSNEIVQSFYASGTFGKEMEEELIKIKTGVEKYYDSLVNSNGLIPVTSRTIQTQRDLLNRSYKGGN